jgi:flagellar motor switch protein FliM
VRIRNLRAAEASVLVNLGQATITVGDLVNLNVGDVIPLTQDADGELEVQVEGVPKFKCFFGISRGNRAVQVTRFVEED